MNYPSIDNHNYDTTWIAVQEGEIKVMPYQVQAVLVLSTGEIAISGGPDNYEVLIYKHALDAERGRRDKLVLSDTLDCNGCKVH